MVAMKWVGYACLVLAIGFSLFIGRAENGVIFAGVLSCAIAGMMFLGFDRALCLLADIRDAMVPAAENAHVDVVHDARPLRSLAQLGEDLERLQGKRASS